MLKSKMYTKYFPVKNHNTKFNDEEKKLLCRWARIIQIEANSRLQEGKKAYNLGRYNRQIMVQMIENNIFDDYYLACLNMLLYRHKYNAFLSIWTYPVLVDNKIEEYFGDVGEPPTTLGCSGTGMSRHYIKPSIIEKS